MENKLFGVSATPLTNPPPDQKSFPHRVELSNGWFMQLDLDLFNYWCHQQGLDEYDWEFLSGGLLDPKPIMAFKRKDDAVAFRLRFGL